MKKIVETTTHVAQNAWWLHILWVLGGAVLGMAVAAVFAGIFRLPRNVYLVPYALLAGAYLFAYTRWSELDLSEFIRHHWVSGVIGGAMVGVGVMSLAYLVTGNPLSAVISHVAMHGAAVLYGLESVRQLPPHY